MKVNLTKAILLSLLAHALFLSFLIYYNIQGEEPLGSEFVSVEIIGDDVAQDSFAPPNGGGSPANHVAERFSVPQEPWNPKGFRYENYDNHQNGTQASTGGTNGQNTSPGSSTGNPTLAKIRTKIERSKYYPQQARLQRLEGRPEVSFKIAPDGSIRSVELKRSSGNALLDSAAIETVNRAAPLPYYEDRISLAINFTLR